MSTNYFPSNDQAYRTWLLNFVTQLSGNLAQVGLVAADLTPLQLSSDTFDSSLSSHFSAQVAAKAASNKKTQDRGETEQLLRPLVQRICKHPGMDDALRGILGLPVPGSGGSEVPIGDLIPVVFLETSPGEVTVHWGPEPGNERINGKPAGVWAANIYRKKPADEQYVLVGASNSSPFRDLITGPASDYMYVVQYRAKDPAEVSRQSAAQIIAARGELAA